MDLIKDVRFFLAVVIFLLSFLSCSAAIVTPEKIKSDRSSSGVTQYMGYAGQGYGLGYGAGAYPGAYPAVPIPGLVPPYANGGGYLGLGTTYNGYYPPYGELMPPAYPMMPPMVPPMVPPVVPPVYPMQPPMPAIPYPGYYPEVMRPGLGYSPYSARKENTDARA